MSTTEPARTRMPRELRRRQVVAAALEVFSSVGYHAASMDDIAVRAGVSKPVVYQHFPSKLELYLAILDAGIEDLIASARTALSSTTDNAVRVRNMVNAYFDFVADDSGAFRVVFESDLSNEPAVRERAEAAEAELARLSADVIAGDTGLSHDEALLIATGTLGTVQVAALRWLRDGTISREKAAEVVTSLAWRGISGFPMTHPPTTE
ncbi:MAG: TetR/AcrR family transcriptional regulator [Candidatus Nanopelagicales bacterium]